MSERVLSVLSLFIKNMKYTKYIIVVVLLVLTNLITYFFSSHEVIWGHNYNPDGTQDYKPWIFSLKDSYYNEVYYCGRVLDVLHMCWKHDKQFWEDSIRNTSEYHELDSLCEQEWEDFYEEW